MYHSAPVLTVLASMKTLVLGGVRSGKSRLAEQLAIDSGMKVTYIATAIAGDAAMAQRIEAHKKRRPYEWQLVEEPLYLANTLVEHAGDDQCLLVDCLTLWLTNCLIHDDKALFGQQRELLIDRISVLPGRIILVSNETSMGITPMGELSRRFCDEAGQLHQDIATISDRVILTVAGLPHFLKGEKL